MDKRMQGLRACILLFWLKCVIWIPDRLHVINEQVQVMFKSVGERSGLL